MSDPAAPVRQGLGRRGLLGYLGATAAGAAAGTALGVGLGSRDAVSAQGAAPQPPGATVSPYGPHQPGIAQHTPAAAEVLALTLLPAALPANDPVARVRLLKVWTGTVEALTRGRVAPGDATPYMAQANSDLTITVGLGARAMVGIEPPPGFEAVPDMDHDRLRPEWSGGDLYLSVAAKDATTVQHAVRRLLADAAPWAQLAWRQVGSWNGIAADGRPQTGRNHFGQIDGSGNPTPGTEEFDRTVWIADGPWAGGSTVVVRRISMDIVEWEKLTPDEQQISVGRRLDNGAPLTGTKESDDLDIDALDASGRRIIAMDAHSRRSHPDLNGGARIFRKGLNYVHGDGADPETGLVFVSYQASVADQFTPIQRMLDTGDQLNEWTTAIGSAEFAVLPGFAEGEWLGQRLFEG